MNEIQLKIIKELSKGISLERNHLANNIGFPRTTVFYNLEKLNLERIVFSYCKFKSIRDRGKPEVYWYIPSRIIKIIKNKNFINLEGIKK